MRQRGFSLIELAVAVAIIAVLAGLAFPVYRRTVAHGKTSACLNNLRQLGVALNLYLGDHDMTMPVLEAGRRDRSEDVPVIDNTLNQYAPYEAVFACPADHRNLAEITGTSYYWNVALNGQRIASLNFLALVDNPSRIPILSDKEGFHPYEENKVNVLYADGHATKDLKFFTQ